MSAHGDLLVPDAEMILERLAEITERIEAAGADPARIRIVAVTKTFGTDVVRAALEAGLTHFGENYADELVAKATALEGADVAWHFIGNIQRNKVARLVPYVALWEGVARLEEGAAIAKRAPGAPVLVEIETTGQPQRSGVRPEEASALVGRLRDLELEVAGLMTVAPQGGGDPAREAFETVRALADELGLAVRSMGMSEDFELAVAAGSTEVRLGTALFGPRATPR